MPVLAFCRSARLVPKNACGHGFLNRELAVFGEAVVAVMPVSVASGTPNEKGGGGTPQREITEISASTFT